MTWKDIHQQTCDRITIMVSKSYYYHLPIYSVRLGTLKEDAKVPGKLYLSPFLPSELLEVEIIAGLILSVKAKIQADKEYDTELEARRVKELSTKKQHDKNGMSRATGKTARKRAKEEAKREAAKSAAR